MKACKKLLREPGKIRKNLSFFGRKREKALEVRSTEESPSGGHGFPLKNPKDLKAFIEEIYGSEFIPQEINKWCNELSQTQIDNKKSPPKPLKKVQAGVSRALMEKKKKGYPLVSISSDLPGSTGVADFPEIISRSLF